MAVSSLVTAWINRASDDDLIAKEVEYAAQAQNQDLSPRDVETRHQILYAVRKEIKERGINV